MAVGEEREDRAGDHRVAGKRLDVVGVEAIDEMMRFILEGEKQGGDGRPGDRERRIAEAGEEAEAERCHAPQPGSSRRDRSSRPGR